MGWRETARERLDSTQVFDLTTSDLRRALDVIDQIAAIPRDPGPGPDVAAVDQQAIGWNECLAEVRRIIEQEDQ